MASQKRIDAYLDCNSPYSLFAFTWLRRNKEALREHGVAVDFHPIFLGGVNVGSGNQPPWTLPAKAAYGKYDRPRAERYFNVAPLNPPPFFPIMTLLPMRSMLVIRHQHPTPLYEAAFESLWTGYWGEHMDLSKPEMMVDCLKRTFSENEAEEIVRAAGTKEYKDLLARETAGVVAKGAFGAPWFEVRDGRGMVQPFFGSDRFHYMLQYLDVPFQDIEILSPKVAKL